MSLRELLEVREFNFWCHDQNFRTCHTLLVLCKPGQRLARDSASLRSLLQNLFGKYVWQDAFLISLEAYTLNHLQGFLGGEYR